MNKRLQFVIHPFFILISLLMSLVFVSLLLLSCKRSKSSSDKAYSTEEMFVQLETKLKNAKYRTGLMEHLDSVYARFPAITAIDEYRYLHFKMKLIDALPENRKSNDTVLVFSDSIVHLLEKSKLDKQLSTAYITAFRDRGNAYLKVGNIDSSIFSFFRSYQIAIERGDYCEAVKGIEGQERVAVQQSRLDYAATVIHESLPVLTKCDNKDQVFYYTQRFLDDLGFINLTLDHPDSAIYYHQQAIHYIESNKQYSTSDTLMPTRALANIYSNLSIAYMKAGRFPLAESSAQKSVDYAARITDDSSALTISRIQQIYILSETKNLQYADQEIEKIWPKVQQLSGNYQIYLLNLAIKIAKSMNQHDKWMNYSLDLYKLRDSMSLVEQERLRKDPAAKLEKMDKEYQVQLLTQQNQLKQSRVNAAIAIGVLLLLLVAVFLSLFFRLRKRLKKQLALYRELEMRERQLKEAIGKLAIQEKQKREEELYYQEIRLQIRHKEDIISQRRRISEDLHDDLSSSLAALRYYIEDVSTTVSSEKDKDAFTSIRQEVETIYVNARKYMHSLHQNLKLSQFDLINLLEEMQAKFNHKTRLEFRLNINKEKVRKELTIFQQDQLYHIVNEAISNVLKHSNATIIDISLSLEESRCVFTIADNGEGFSRLTNSDSSGIGMRSMQQRVRELDGELNVQSGLEGTRISGVFPVHFQDQHDN